MTSEPPAASRRLRQQELCDRFGWNYREVAQTARQLGLSTHAYLQQKTGWRWQNELYYPPEEMEF